MSIGTVFYGELITLINPEKLPEDIAFIEDGAEALLGKLFFADGLIQRTPAGESGYTYLRLITTEQLSFGLNGASGMRLILNPNPTGESSFPVSFRYHWEILRYKNIGLSH